MTVPGSMDGCSLKTRIVRGSEQKAQAPGYLVPDQHQSYGAFHKSARHLSQNAPFSAYELFLQEVKHNTRVRRFLPQIAEIVSDALLSLSELFLLVRPLVASG
jgi:hypothetical protein